MNYSGFYGIHRGSMQYEKPGNNDFFNKSWLINPHYSMLCKAQMFIAHLYHLEIPQYGGFSTSLAYCHPEIQSWI